MSSPVTESSPTFWSALQKLMSKVSLNHSAVFTIVQFVTRPSPETGKEVKIAPFA